MPAVYTNGLFAAEGGLMSYGFDVPDMYRRLAASYADRILRGARPGELPVQAPTVFQLVINLKTAKALGITVPPTLVAKPRSHRVGLERMSEHATPVIGITRSTERRTNSSALSSKGPIQGVDVASLLR